MDPLQRLLQLLQPRSEAESTWLKTLVTFITEHLSSVSCGPAPPAADGSETGVRCELSVYQLSVCVVQQIQQRMCVAHSLPVSYRLLSVSELVSQQHLACVSNLSWSTNQQRAWAREAELSVPGKRALLRVNLLLIGCLREGRGGELRLMDGSGSVRCECLSPSPLWLNRPVFLPHWNYIPQNASGQDEAGGCVELIGSPVPLCPGPEQGLAGCAGAGLINVVGVREAAGLLHHRVRGQRLAVWGQVGSVCPLLVVAGTTFFCFTLTDQSQSVPVLVKECSRLFWCDCVCVGHSVCVTALRVCVMRGWRGNNILCVTECSELQTDYTPTQTHTDYTTTNTQEHTHTDDTPTHTQEHTHTDDTPTHTQEHTHTDDTPTQTHTDNTTTNTQEHTHTDDTPTQTHTDNTTTNTQEHTHTPAEHTPTGMDTPLLMMSHTDDREEAEPIVQSCVRMRKSRVISYQGTVTKVISEGAGLYMIDGKVGLCLAYQPTARRKLRAGDRVELHHVHFLFRPCPDFPPSMLCCCLRSTLKVTAFSRVGGAGPLTRCPGDGALPRLLLQDHRNVSEYLWACHLSSQLTHSLVPGVLKQQCVCLLSWRLMETLWGRGGRRRRDIYSEMLDEPHTCPLTQYTVDSAAPQYISISELCRSLQLDSWSSVPLKSLLPPDGQSLPMSQINTALSWSCRTLSSETGDGLRQRPLLLVGVLDLPSQTSELKQTLQLRDATGGVACITTETSEDNNGGQRASYNTAWIGCLVCVRQFTMVTERFLQSDFPSYQHLDQDRFITHQQTRVYLQFSLDHLHILSPTAAMAIHLRHKGEELVGDVTARKQTAEEEKTASRKRRREEEAGSSHSASSVTMTMSSVGGGPQPSVSMVIRVEQKEGVAWRNTGAASKEEAGLTLCFSVRAAVIGPVVIWGRDPKNGPMTAREAEREGEDKVVLVFSGACARWFPVLHPGCFYRLVAANTQDPCVLISSGVELYTDSTLQVGSDWRFHTLTCSLLLHTCRQVLSSTVLSVSEVLDSRSELVYFKGLVSDRISVRDGTAHCGQTGVRLTLCDQSGRSLNVYLDLSHTPYPPGLLPGNTLLLSAFQRRQSRTGSVYCTSLPVSSMTVISLGDTSLAPPPPPAPMMHLGPWALSSEQRCIVGQIKGHVVCFLFLQLQWSCSLCGSVYTQSCCSSQCRSTSSIFQSKAKLVIDDGTGEAHVWFSGEVVRPLLGLAGSQWEGLQRVLRVKGHIRVYPRGRSLVCDGDSDDSLFNFLMCLCSSDVICRPISLTCRKHTYLRTQEVRRFSRADRDFITTLPRPLQLTCLHLH